MNLCVAQQQRKVLFVTVVFPYRHYLLHRAVPGWLINGEYTEAQNVTISGKVRSFTIGVPIAKQLQEEIRILLNNIKYRLI